MLKFKIEKKIFEKWPQVRIGVVVAEGLDNSKLKVPTKWAGRQSQKSKVEKSIEDLLREEEERKRRELAGVDIKELPKVARWREIYQQFGSKPREYRFSIEALLRRVANGNKLPDINPLVNLYNYISIKYFLTVGAEDLDKVKGEIVLKICSGNEKGKYIGDEQESVCYPGEVAYCDNQGFICRRWNWREGDRTKIEPETKRTVVVLEANEAVTDEELQAALKETADLIRQYLGGKTMVEILDKNRQESVLI